MKRKKSLFIKGIVVFVCIIATITTTACTRLDSDRVGRLLDLGNKYLLEGNYEEAILTFEKIIEIEPRNIEARIGLAKAYIGDEKLNKAKRILEEIFELDEREEEAYNIYADILIQQGKIEEARDILEKGYDNTKSKAINARLDELNSDILKDTQEPEEHPEDKDKEPQAEVEAVIQGGSGNLASNLVQDGEVAFDENNIYIINKNTNAIEVRNESGKSTLFDLPKKRDMYHRYSSINIYNNSVYVVSSLYGEKTIIKRNFDGNDWEVLAEGGNLQIYADKLYYLYEDTLISKSVESGEEEILLEDVYDFCIYEGNAVIRRINAYDVDDFGSKYISDLTLYILNLASKELTEITRIKDFVDTASKVVLDDNFIYHDMAKGIERIDVVSGETKNISNHITDTLELGFCDGFAVTEEKIYIVFLDPNKIEPKIIVINKDNPEKFDVVDCNMEAYNEYLTKLYEWCYTQGDPGWISINVYYANNELFIDRLGHYDESLNWLGKDVACDEPWTSYWE